MAASRISHLEKPFRKGGPEVIESFISTFSNDQRFHTIYFSVIVFLLFDQSCAIAYADIFILLYIRLHRANKHVPEVSLDSLSS